MPVLTPLLRHLPPCAVLVQCAAIPQAPERPPKLTGAERRARKARAAEMAEQVCVRSWAVRMCSRGHAWSCQRLHAAHAAPSLLRSAVVATFRYRCRGRHAARGTRLQYTAWHCMPLCCGREHLSVALALHAPPPLHRAQTTTHSSLLHSIHPARSPLPPCSRPRWPAAAWQLLLRRPT